MNRQEIIEKNTLSKSTYWKKIRLYLFEEIKNKASMSSSDGTIIKAMLKTIDIIDKWQNDYLNAFKAEEKKGL